MLREITKRDERDQNNSWHANLDLRFFAAKDRTICSVADQFGPIKIQKPFYPESDGTAHVYLIHPPSGYVGGDRLDISVTAKRGSRVLLTTPGASKFYCSASEYATVNNVVNVQDDAFVEWLPQETIVYNGALAKQSLHVSLSVRAKFIGWEIQCLGRNSAAHGFVNGWLHNRFEIARNQQPLLIERSRIQGGSERLTARYAWANFTVSGVMVATCDNDQCVNDIRNRWQASPQSMIAVTVLNGLTICRYLGYSAIEAREYFTDAWMILRDEIQHKTISLPRIWAT